MPNDKLKKLHDILVSKGIDRKSFEEFQNNFYNNEDKQKKLHDILVSKGIDRKSFKEFQNNFFVKKKDVSDSTSQEDVMESITKEEEIPTLSASLYEDDEESEIAKKLEANTRRVVSSSSRIPLFLAEQVFTLMAPKELKDKVNEMPAEQREDYLSSLVSMSSRSVGPGGIMSQLTPQLTDLYQSQSKKIKEIEDTYRRYDTSIGEDFKNLDLGQALDRTFTEVIGGLPQLVQTMAPGVGLASIALGSAAEKSGELQREGEDLDLKTSLNSIVSGAAEGIFETVTRKLGKKILDSFKVNPDETLKSLGDKIKEIFIDSGMEGGSELATSVVQTLSDVLIQGKEINFYDALREAIDSFIIGGATGGSLTGGAKAISTVNNIAQKSILSKKLKDSKYNSLDDVFIPAVNKDGSLSDKTNIDQVTLDIASSDVSRKFVVKGLNNSVKKGKLTREEADKRLADFDNIRKANEKVSKDIEGEDRLKAVDLIREKNSIQEEIKDIDPALTKNKEARIQEINNELEQIANKESVQEQKTRDIPDAEEEAVKPKEGETSLFSRKDKKGRTTQFFETKTEKDGITTTRFTFNRSDKDPSQRNNAIMGIPVDKALKDEYEIAESEIPEDTEVFGVVEIREGSRGASATVTFETEGQKFQGEVKLTPKKPTSTQAAEGVREVEEEVREPAVEEKKEVKKPSQEQILKDVQEGNVSTFVYPNEQSVPDVFKDKISSIDNITGEHRVTISKSEADFLLQEESRQAEAASKAEADTDTEQTVAKKYAEELKEIKESNPQKYWSVDEVTEEDAAKGTVIDTEDGAAVVGDDGDIKGVFKKLTSKARGVAQVLLKKAVEAGGTKLDNFVTGAEGVKLQEIYEKAGFRVVSRTPFNEKYAPKGWTEKDGRPDVVAMVYDPNNELDIEEKMFDDPVNGYDQMIAYRDKVLADSQKSNGLSKLREVFGKKAAGAMRVNNDDVKAKIKTQANKAMESIKKKFPNLSIEVFDNENDYHEAIGESDQSRGTYSDGKVYINLERATETTVAHEVFHGIFASTIKSDARIQKLMNSFIESLSRTQDPAIIEAFKDQVNGVEQYKDVFSEEVMAELFGTIAGQNQKLKPQTRSIVKKFLDNLAKLFGLKPFTDSEVIDVMNTLAGKISEGAEITESDVNLFKGGKVVDNPIQAITKKSVGLFDVQYTEENRRKELIDKGLLVEIDDVRDLSGLNTTITSPDDMLAGTISIDGKQIFEGGGGVFFVTKYGDVWASGKKGTANTLSKMINDSLKENEGRGLLVLTKGADQKLISSVSGVNSSLAILDVMLDKGLISPSDFRTAVSGSVKKAGGIIKLGGSAKQIKSDINEYFSDPTTTTFEKRGNVVKDILGRLAQSKSVKENSNKIIELLGGDVNKKIGKGNTKLSQSLGDLVAGVAAEKLTKGLSVGDVYAIIEVNSEVEVVEDSHPSYPFHVRLKDGSKPKLMLPKNRQNGSEILKTSTGKVYKVGNVSVLSGSFNQDIKSKKQVSGRPSIDEVRKYAKENKIPDADVRAFLKEVGYSDPEIKVAMKKAPSAKKILGKKPIKKTVDTYAALKDQIRLEARAARDAQKDLNSKRKDLARIIKDLARKGVITANQSTVLINKISSVNLNNNVAVDRLIEYMDKVYQNAEYADNILRSNKKRKKAQKNIKSKIGSAKVVFNSLNKLFSIDAKLIPQDVLDVYNSLVNQFGDSKAVLSLEDVSIVNEKANSVLEAIDREVSEIPNLQVLFQSLEKVNVKGKLSFSETLNKAEKDGNITKEELDLMKKYKKDILPSEPNEVKEFEPAPIEFKENNVSDQMEKEGANRLLDLLKNKKAVDQLDPSLRKNIQSVVDNIDAGFFPSYANNIANEIESIIAKDNVLPRIKKGKYIFDRISASIKRIFSSNRSTTEYQIRQNPLSDIDNVLGNMNRTDIYDNIFGKAAKAYATMDANIDVIREKLSKADALLFKQFKNNGNKVTESKFRIMAYMLEREFQSNRDSDKVFSAKEAISETIKEHKKGKIEGIYSKRDVKILESIMKDYEGDVDIDSEFKKFSKREREVIGIIDEVNGSISDKALYTASVVRGSRPNMIDNYVHHSVAKSNDGQIETVSSKYNQFKTFSTKAGTLVERTPGAKPLNFDVLTATMRGATETLTDYHMTDTARVIFKTLNKIQAEVIGSKSSTDRDIEIANALIKAFDTAMRQAFETNYMNNGLDLLSKFKGLGYKALLASVPRAMAELNSNLAYVMISSPKEWTSGASMRDYVLSQSGRDVMINLNSEQTGKLYSHKVTGKTADVGLFADADGVNKTGAVNDVQNKATQIVSYLKGVTTKPVEKIAEFLISSPDRAISRPLWFGSLKSKFKDLTGKDIDIEAIKNGDKFYLRENKEALDEATKHADKEVTRAATSINVFNGVLKNKIDPKDSASLKILKEINGFMTNFIVYEYTTTRSALTALMHEGKISKRKGASLLMATMSRMSLYMVLYQTFTHMFDSVVSAMTGLEADEEEYPEEDMLIRQLVGSVSSVVLGKNLGNIAKIVPNLGIEYINENYLEDLRKGEDFDPYKHSISFSILSKEDLKKIQSRQKGVGDVLLNSFSGPYSPVVKTLSRAIGLSLKATSDAAKDETKQKAIDELSTRIAIEMLGNMGLIPFYKDVRRIAIKDFFKEEPKKKMVYN